MPETAATTDSDTALYWIVRAVGLDNKPYEDLWEGYTGFYVRTSGNLYEEISSEEANKRRVAGEEIFALAVSNHTQGTRVGLFRDEAHLHEFVRRNMRGTTEPFEV